MPRLPELDVFVSGWRRPNLMALERILASWGLLEPLGLDSGFLEPPGLDSGLLGAPGLDSGLLGLLGWIFLS